ncbi:hypothetical protein PR003_g6068 [Phytophthora rubi]|uniref:Uncharacterized protein n=1 Tax=Phytophthora rubi TaxID=129364 RepID=A0A6A4G1P7_9STRA|nr:hypothetical protein PR001_g6280 [Phytophthora rubi]KAE9349093.1 hypothetical protein PR003_g6068 [Phytophthora rubi]
MGPGLKTQLVENHDALVVRRHTNYCTWGAASYLIFRLQMANGYTVCFRMAPVLGILQALVVDRCILLDDALARVRRGWHAHERRDHFWRVHPRRSHELRGALDA